MDEDLRILEQEYCPPIDPALLHAIYSDYVGQPDALALLREFLDPLKAAAAVESLTDFDPSGSSGGPVHDSQGKGSTDVDSAESWATQTVSTDTTNPSNDLSTLSLASGSANGSEASLSGGYFKDTQHFDTDTKELLLAQTFPSLTLEKIAYTLRKCNNDFGRTTDELLNHVYFEDSRASPTEDGPVAKGIDAFSEEFHVPQRGKKGKTKKKQRAVQYKSDTTFSSGSDGSGTTTPNHWQNSSRDVEYITSRTELSHKTVSSLYHESGASLSATVLAAVRKDIRAQQKESEPDAGLVQDAITLNADFPTIDLDHALALIRLAGSSIPNAQDLAKALTQQAASETGGKGGLRVDVRYAPLNLSDDTPGATSLPALAPSARPRDSASIARARAEAFQQASTAYRKGRSTPLMKAAAGYYAQEGRDLNANLKAMSAAEADSFVSSQSGPTYLDLHGVTVADATRIAKQRTRTWWDGLGERRIPEWSGPGRRGGGEAYRIITGLGRHSEGGRGKLGPAVAKALVQEGWKVEVNAGELLVVGVARRR